MPYHLATPAFYWFIPTRKVLLNDTGLLFSIPDFLLCLEFALNILPYRHSLSAWLGEDFSHRNPLGIPPRFELKSYLPDTLKENH
jgi:hypothetical protein